MSESAFASKLARAVGWLMLLVGASVFLIRLLRHEKYGVQRLATSLGIFGRSAGEGVVAVRLDRCPRA